MNEKIIDIVQKQIALSVELMRVTGYIEEDEEKETLEVLEQYVSGFKKRIKENEAQKQEARKE